RRLGGLSLLGLLGTKSAQAQPSEKNNLRDGEEQEPLELDQAACARALGNRCHGMWRYPITRAHLYNPESGQLPGRIQKVSAGDTAVGALASGTARWAGQSGRRGACAYSNRRTRTSARTAA